MYKISIGLLALLGLRNLYSNTLYFVDTWKTLVDQGITHKYLLFSMTVGGGFVWVSIALATCLLGLLIIRKEDSKIRLLTKTAWGGLLSYVGPPFILMGGFAFTVWIHRFIG